jgi:hypothetical protein
MSCTINPARKPAAAWASAWLRSIDHLATREFTKNWLLSKVGSNAMGRGPIPAPTPDTAGTGLAGKGLFVGPSRRRLDAPGWQSSGFRYWQATRLGQRHQDGPHPRRRGATQGGSVTRSQTRLGYNRTPAKSPRPRAPARPRQAIGRRMAQDSEHRARPALRHEARLVATAPGDTVRHRKPPSPIATHFRHTANPRHKTTRIFLPIIAQRCKKVLALRGKPLYIRV